ncbi:5-oxoprolinase subunit PxpB [Roseateles sp. BYS87W]|uniref:5-oxoprolinase subunit PxpB n=1 Tax=Pelomonas baiyunensis TaxID=3299026 RepID=A0ABW7GVV3_9BURK
MTALAIHPLGEAALCCHLPPPATLAQQARLWRLSAALNGHPGVEALTPGMNNLTVGFDPLATDPAALEADIQRTWQTLATNETGEDTPTGRRVDVPVHYDGPDLADVAAHHGLSTDEVVRLHTAAEYVVYFIGFQPGFAYLGGLDPRLHTPRRAEPRTQVPAGSVGIGGAQTGIYPLASPGGWQLIGRTALPLFNPAAEPPTLLAPGDRVRFVAEAL